MYINGLMDSKPNSRCGDPGLFPGMGDYIFALQFFEGSKEETMDR